MFGLDKLSKIVDFKSNSDSDDLEFFFVEGEVQMREKIKNLQDYLGVNTRINIGIKRADYSGVYDSRVEDITKKYILISHRSALNPL